jgi:hypothetical protein
LIGNQGKARIGQVAPHCARYATSPLSGFSTPEHYGYLILLRDRMSCLF